jgi:hypothetical protein
MDSDRPEPDVQALWQQQLEAPAGLTVPILRRKIESMESAARRRRLVFWISIVNNVAICAALAWFMPPARPFVAIFFLAVSLAQIQALTRSTAIAAPADAGLLTSVAFLRAMLQRERTFAGQAWLWFLVPAGIGELALAAGMWTTGGPPLAAAVALAAFVIAVFAFVFVGTRRRARRLQMELEALG